MKNPVVNPAVVKTGGVSMFVGNTGIVVLSKQADLLRDEVIGKLLHSNILDSMDSVGFTVVNLDAKTVPSGGVRVSYEVYLSPADLVKLPSIYDVVEPVKKVRKKKERRS